MVTYVGGLHFSKTWNIVYWWINMVIFPTGINYMNNAHEYRKKTRRENFHYSHFYGNELKVMLHGYNAYYIIFYLSYGLWEMWSFTYIYQSIINHLETQIFYNNIYVDVVWGNGKCLR